MLRYMVLGLVLSTGLACSSGDDNVVMIRDGGPRDAGEVPDGGRDGGLSVVEMQTFGANYTEQGCSNGCLIRNFALTVTLRNNSEFFQIDKVEGLRVEIGTFVLEQRGQSCSGSWWRAPKNGATAAQRITANLFDVDDADQARKDNAAVQYDCNADNDGMIVDDFAGGGSANSDEMVKITVWGELEDNTAWEASGEVTANKM